MGPSNEFPKGEENQVPRDNNGNAIGDAGIRENPAHISEPPYNMTLPEALAAKNSLSEKLDTEQLRKLQDGTYWSENPPAAESSFNQPSPEEQQEVRNSAVEQDTKKSRTKLIVGGVTVALVGTAAYFGVNAMSGNENEAPTAPVSPSNEAPITPGESVEPTEAPVTPEVTPSPTDIPTTFDPTPDEVQFFDSGRPIPSFEKVPGDSFQPVPFEEEQNYTIEDLEIPVNLEGEDLARAIISRLDAWVMASSMPSVLEADDNFYLSREEYAEKLTTVNAELFTSALFHPDINPDTVDTFTERNRLQFRAYQASGPSNPENLERAHVYTVLGETGASDATDINFFHRNGADENEWEIRFDTTRYDNSDLNNVADGALTEGKISETLVVLHKTDSAWQIQGYAELPRYE